MARTDVDRDAARRRVEEELADRGWNIADLAREAGVDPGTVGDFVGGSRWPQFSTRGKLAAAFGWTPDSIDRAARGEEIRAGSGKTVSALDQDGGVLLSLPPDAFEGLSPADREEAISAAKATLLERAREIRRRLDQR